MTGLAGGVDGRVIIIENVGSNNLVLKDESASSTAANRFALSSDITIIPDSSAVLKYDATSSRWRILDIAGAHVAASAAVHGLQSGANVLGNKSAVGEFVLRGTAMTGAGTGMPYSVSSDVSVTFPVAFASAPIVIACGMNYQGLGCVGYITASGCVIRGLAQSGGSLMMQWIAIGS
jgi:hypothetical protein